MARAGVDRCTHRFRRSDRLRQCPSDSASNAVVELRDEPPGSRHVREGADPLAGTFQEADAGRALAPGALRHDMVFQMANVLSHAFGRRGPVLERFHDLSDGAGRDDVTVCDIGHGASFGVVGLALSINYPSVKTLKHGCYYLPRR